MFLTKKYSSPTQIQTLEELRIALGENFLIFCGSAVSGPRRVNSKERKFLPMVQNVIEEFFCDLSSILQNGNYFEQTISAYADSLINGKYARLRWRTKFEDFILRLESIIGPSYVESFLRALFQCDKGQFAANHAAIAYLLRQRIAIGCLTTNFDNAIERAWPELRIYVDHPDNPN